MYIIHCVQTMTESEIHFQFLKAVNDILNPLVEKIETMTEVKRKKLFSYYETLRDIAIIVSDVDKVDGLKIVRLPMKKDKLIELEKMFIQTYCELINFMTDNDIDVSANDNKILRVACSGGYCDIAKLLINKSDNVSDELLRLVEDMDHE